MTTADSLPALTLDTDGRAQPETDAERELLKAVKTGEPAIFPDAPEPKDKKGWTDQNTIRADFLRHLCLHPTRHAIDPKGVQLHSARITGALDFESATLSHPLWVFNSRFEDEITFLDAQTRSLGFVDCHLTKLSADRLSVTGTLKLTRSTILGETRLVGADITGNLECTGATFTHAGSDAFSADGLIVGGGVFLKNTIVTGATRLLGADITGNLECHGATFIHKGDEAFNAERLVVGGRFFWTKFNAPPQGHIDLNHARIGDFFDDGSGWPNAGEGHLVLDGLCYETIGPDTTAKTLRAWLGRMPATWNGKPAFWPQPYEQLTKVLRAAGHDRDARGVAMAKQDAYRKHLRAEAMHKEDGHYAASQMHFLLRMWLWLEKYTLGYGYMPWRALYWIAAVIVFGAVVFGYAHQAHYMHVAKERVYMDEDYKEDYKIDRKLPPEYPRFNALAFSADVMIPFVDLHQENYWEPKSDGFYGGLLRFYFWLHIALGWILATLAAAGLAGVIKKD